MRILGLAGWSGSGKTTLLIRLLPILTARGFRVSTMKHAHHSFDVDKPGKDSYLHREAGATEVMVSSAQRWALMHEHRDAPEPTPDELVRHMTPVDLLIIEGFKSYPHDKLEIFRPSVGKPLLAGDDPHIVAVVTDEPAKLTVPVPVLNLDDVPQVAQFIVSHCGLNERSGPWRS